MVQIHYGQPTTVLERKSIWSWSKDKREAELTKCQPLCKNCHKEKTKEYLRSLMKHGTYSYWYRVKCRCLFCIEAMRAYKKDYRIRTGIH